MGRKTGKLVLWDDDAGYGFIDDDEAKRLFVHISNVRRARRRPQPGDDVTYLLGFGRDGRFAAKAVTILSDRRPPVALSSPVPGTIVRLLAAALILFCALAATHLARAQIWLFGAYLLLGTVSFFFYWSDKEAAEDRHWRVRESSLHFGDMIGGIAGGLLAQALLRHKTRKAGFAAATWLIALLHVIALTGLILGFWDLPELPY